MNLHQKKSVSTILRIFSIFFVILVITILFMIFLVQIPTLNAREVFSAKDGILDVRRYTIASSAPLYLDCEWEYFPELFLDEQSYSQDAMSSHELIDLPISSIALASQKGTYRLFLKTSSFDEDLVLYIPYINGINIFVNGNVLHPLESAHSEIQGGISHFLYYLDHLDPQRDMQEIVISLSPTHTQTTLYNRSIIIGSMGSIIALFNANTANVMLLFGIVILIILSGFTFMILMPNHKLITLITIFDTMLMLRITFGLNEIFVFLQGISPIFYFSDQTLLSLQIFFLMCGGLVGSLLARHLFDPENKIPKFLTVPLPYIYGFLAIFFSVNLNLFDQYGIPCILAVYLYTFLVVFMQYIVYWKRGINFYSIFQTIKTTYIGIVVFVDIYLMKTKGDLLYFSFLYVLFFMAHVFIRLYDNNMSYKAVESLNENLENTVRQRTAELSRANKVLSELSIRDPLTNAYNRLHFERTMEKAVNEYGLLYNTLHICMFDLDHFKSINDTYGHDAGDEQLKYVVETILKNVDTRTMLARVGGEEFVLLFYDIPSEEVLDCVENIRKIFQENSKEVPARTTASFGLVKYHTELSIKDFLKWADKCLYRAKNTGRNKVVYNFFARP